MVELGIFKVNQSVIWNGKQTDTTKEKRNNHARIHFTFNCCQMFLKTQKGQKFLKTKQDKNNFLIGNLLPDTTKIKARSHFRDPKYHDRMIEYPETSWFIKKYKHLLSNSSVVGYLFHLYIDRRFFKYYMPRIVEFRNAQDEREERRDMVKDVLLKRTGQRLSKQDFSQRNTTMGTTQR